MLYVTPRLRDAQDDPVHHRVSNSSVVRASIEGRGSESNLSGFLMVDSHPIYALPRIYYLSGNKLEIVMSLNRIFRKKTIQTFPNTQNILLNNNLTH